METKREGPADSAETTARKIGIVAAVAFVAYALFGYFTDNIMILIGDKYGGGGPMFAHGEQAELAAFGYVSFAVAVLLGTFARPYPPDKVPSGVIWSVVFIVIGLLLAGFRTPG